MGGNELFLETEVSYRNLVCSLAVLAGDHGKLHDVLKSLSTEELRTLAESTRRINDEAETWLY
jgi:hypothetical protein